MARKYCKYIIICFVFLILLSSCSLNQLFCVHAYKTTITDSTCSKLGEKVEICSKCNKVKTSKISKKDHDYFEEIVDPTCSEEGFTLKTCVNCNHQEKSNYVDKLEHSNFNWEIVLEPSETSDGLEMRECDSCGYYEKRIITSLSYIDLDIIKFDINNGTLSAKNFKELQLIFDACILNEKTVFSIKYSTSNLNNTLSELVNNCSIGTAINVSCSSKNGYLKFNVIYNSKPLNKTPHHNLFTQYDSLNKCNFQSSRGDNYNEFKIENSLYEYEVRTSEQLFYCLERGVYPNVVPESEAYFIFEECKKVLREIIDEKMSEFEKVKAIHDWIILNVTYDEELLNLAASGATGLSNYRGFFLEGVFFDKVAVCEGISKAFCVLANIEGIPCVVVEGYQTNNPKGLGHAWNKVFIDNNWYIVDVTSDGLVLNNSFEVLSYQHFLISDDEMKIKYTGKNFNNIICNTNYNSYDKMHFNLNNTQYSYKVNNTYQLSCIIKYYHYNKNNTTSIEFYLNFDYGTSITDELQLAYASIGVNFTSSYFLNNNIIIIINH